MTTPDTEVLAKWMIANGYATGHGDTVADLLRELEWQFNERIDRAFATAAHSKEI